MKTKAFIKFAIIITSLLLYLPSISAVDVGEGSIFTTTGSNCTYYMANDFIFTNIIAYPTSLNINDGNITTYPSTGWINMSIEGLGTSIDFTNNVTIVNLTIGNGFANFRLTNGETYDIRYQSNNEILQQVIASENKIVFTNISSGSWQIHIFSMKEMLTEKHVETSKTSYALLGILAIVFLVTFILSILFAMHNSEEVNFTLILTGSVMLIGFFILLYVMLPLFDSLISATGG